MDLNSVGTLASALAALLFVILGLATFRARRSGQETKDLRTAQAISVAITRWAFQVQMKAAANGWDLPPIPKEMTPEYLIGKTEKEPNPELAQIAQIAQLATGLLPGHDVPAEGNKP